MFSINILGFEGHVVSVAATELCKSIHRHDTHAVGWPCPVQIPLQNQVASLLVGFGPGSSWLILTLVNKMRKDSLGSSSAKFIFFSMTLQNVSTLKLILKHPAPALFTLLERSEQQGVLLEDTICYGLSHVPQIHTLKS